MTDEIWQARSAGSLNSTSKRGKFDPCVTRSTRSNNKSGSNLISSSRAFTATWQNLSDNFRINSSRYLSILEDARCGQKIAHITCITGLFPAIASRFKDQRSCRDYPCFAGLCEFGFARRLRSRAGTRTEVLVPTASHNRRSCAAVGTRTPNLLIRSLYVASVVSCAIMCSHEPT